MVRSVVCSLLPGVMLEGWLCIKDKGGKKTTDAFK